MYLRGSKWSMLRRRKPINLGRILILLVLIGGAAYVNYVVVPQTPPLFVPTATPTRAPETFITDAQLLASEGKYGQAIEMYTEAISADPDNVNIFVSQAWTQIYAQKYKDAQTSAENALLLNNNNAIAHALRGWALLFQGEYLTAESSIKRAIELDPNNGLAHSFYAELLIRQIEAGQGGIGTVEKAIEESKLALALAPDTMEAHRARGIVYQNTSNYTEAIQEFQRAIQINPNVADLHMSLGLGYRQLDPPELDSAVTEFTVANALNPSDPMPDLYISRTYANIGEYVKAAQYAEQATIDAPSDPFMWGTLGSMQYRLGKYPEAIAALKLAVRGGTTESGVVVEGLPLDYGRIAEYYYFYGLALAKSGECNEAVQIAQLLIQGAKDDEISVYNANAMITICQGGTIEPPTEEEPIVEAEGTPTVAE